MSRTSSRISLYKSSSEKLKILLLLALGILFAGSLTLLLWFFLVKLPLRNVPATVDESDKWRGDLINSNRANILNVIQTLGSLGFIATAYFAWKNLKVTERTFQVTEDKQATERFREAVNMLAHDKLEIRLGGIYALERLTRDSQEDHPMIMEVLTAFIRDRRSKDKMDSLSQKGSSDIKFTQKLNPDVQTALTVISRRNINNDQQKINLTGTNLVGADLKLANLVEADFGNADLSESDLEGAQLEGATFIGASLEGANLQNANLSRAILWKAILKQANLRKANLKAATLLNADLEDANLTETDLRKVGNLDKGQLNLALLCRTLLPPNINIEPNRDCSLLENEEDQDLQKNASKLQFQILKGFGEELAKSRDVADWIDEEKKALAELSGEKALEKFPALKNDASSEDVIRFYFSILQYLELISHSLRWGAYSVLDEPDIPLVFDASYLYKEAFISFRENLRNNTPQFSDSKKENAYKYIDYLISRF